MKLHELKIKKKYLLDVLGGFKTFEIRKDDRDYRVGDLIAFKWESEDGEWHSSGVVYCITYILRNCPEYGLMDGYCILGINEMEQRK